MKAIFKVSVMSLCLFGMTSCNGNNNKNATSEMALAETVTQKPSNQFIKLALLLDTSNSMDGLIDQVKAHWLGATIPTI